MKLHSIVFAIFSLCLSAMLIASCAKPTPVSIEATNLPLEAPTTENAAGPEIIPTEVPATPEVIELDALPPEPQTVTFTNSAGVELNGYYYPAAVNPAPLVVLMHWPNGDMSDWNEVAVWLQNRGQSNPFPNPVDEYWWDESWFPAMPTDRSYGVFIFSFSNSSPYPVDGTQVDTSNWLDDAQSAMLKGMELEGVDPTRIVSIGSVHGADGAADGCLYLNEQQAGHCVGTLALSPGSYLGQDYPETVQKLGETSPETRVWCIGMEYEISICEYAATLGNSMFTYHKVAGVNQGNLLLQSGIDPLPMQLILDFLDETLK